MNDNKEIIIGIDLGTTFSCVSVVRNGQPEVLEDQGMKITPSVVGFEKETNNPIVGRGAVRQMSLEPENTFYVTKRFMGMSNGAELEILKKHPVAYKVVKGDNGAIEFESKTGKRYTPQVIAAQILKKMRSIAADALHVPIEQLKKAVVTVPAYFGDAQRQATKDAGTIAGLEIVRIINEPTAAALAYGLDKKKNGKIAVFDLGGGTFDVSILEIEDNLFNVKATVGDPFLGGSDFDQKIVDYIVEECKKKHDYDLRKDPQSYSRVREAAEQAKIDLSSRMSTDVVISFIPTEKGVINLSVTITRTKFESLCEDLIRKTEQPCRQALQYANVSAAEIDEILLVGGMTRMPKVIETVAKIFGKQPLKTVNPDEVVAKGAAIQGAILSKTIEGDILLLDVTPMSLGIETLGGVFTVLINKQVTIPVQKKQVFSTAQDNQTGVSITVYQGERPLAKQNKMLGQFILEGIAPAPKGIPQIEVCFDVDANGILQVSATDLATKKEQKIRIESSKMSEEEIQRHVEEAKKYEDEDRKAIKLIEARNKADAAIDSLEKTVREFKDKIDGNLINELDEIKVKLNNVKEGNDPDEITSVTEELNLKLQKVGEAMYQNQPQEDQSTPSAEEKEEPIVE